MLDYLESLLQAAEKEIEETKSREELEALRRKCLGRKSLLAEVFSKLSQITSQQNLLTNCR